MNKQMNDPDISDTIHIPFIKTGTDDEMKKFMSQLALVEKRYPDFMLGKVSVEDADDVKQFVEGVKRIEAAKYALMQSRPNRPPIPAFEPPTPTSTLTRSPSSDTRRLSSQSMSPSAQRRVTAARTSLGSKSPKKKTTPPQKRSSNEVENTKKKTVPEVLAIKNKSTDSGGQRVEAGAATNKSPPKVHTPTSIAERMLQLQAKSIVKKSGANDDVGGDGGEEGDVTNDVPIGETGQEAGDSINDDEGGGDGDSAANNSDGGGDDDDDGEEENEDEEKTRPTKRQRVARGRVM